MKPLPYRIRADLFLQLFRLESAGVAFDRATATLSLPPPAAARLKAMQALAARGADAAKAGEQSGLFSPLEARLVRAALIAGTPAPVYQRLAESYAQRARQASALKSRLLLPALVLAIALVVQPLPSVVSGALGLGAYAWQVISQLLVIAAAVALLAWLVMALPRRVPFLGPIYIRANLRDFFESLALLLEAGVPVLEALTPALDTVADGDIRQELARAFRRVGERGRFAPALEAVSYLEGSPVVAFAHTGEESGKLPEMLMRHAALESEAITRFHEEVAAWLPRLVYALVAIKVVWGIFASGGVAPKIPKDL